jgi:hypothetical protein
VAEAEPELNAASKGKHNAVEKPQAQTNEDLFVDDYEYYKKLDEVQGSVAQHTQVTNSMRPSNAKSMNLVVLTEQDPRY